MNIIILSPMTFSNMIHFFIIYSFGGWVLEIIYRSLADKRFINPGYLIGPFLPLYGITAVTLIYISSMLNTLLFPIQLVIYFVITTCIEYITGIFFEKIFGMKLWDYSDEKFNLNGHISLKFSLLWALAAFIGLYIIHPFVAWLISMVDAGILLYATYVFSAIISIDIIYSFAQTIKFKQKVSMLLENFNTLENVEIQQIFNTIKHFLLSFPNITKILQERLDISIKDIVLNKLTGFKKDMDEKLKNKMPFESEYEGIVQDILTHKEFKKLQNFSHHNRITIFEHVREVSYLSYKIAKYLGLDFKSAARGGLLHDFYLYDWHKEEGRPYKNKLHGFEHPKVALQNAEKYFQLNKKEKDIIIKHMWPLTLLPPVCRESFIVTFVDKYISSKEFLNNLKNNKLVDKLLNK